MDEHPQEDLPSSIQAAMTSGGRIKVFGPAIRIAGKHFDVWLPKEAVAALDDLLDRSDNSLDELVFKSITLYKLALDAEAAGNSLAIVNPDGEIDQEITGL